MPVTPAPGADLASSVSVSLPAQTNPSAHTMLGGKKPHGLQRKERFGFLTPDSCELVEVWAIGTWGKMVTQGLPAEVLRFLLHSAHKPGSILAPSRDGQ
jgi:hypothetical protein